MTNFSNPLMELINDALDSGKPINTGFTDLDLSEGKSAVGCDRNGCINGYIETTDGKMEYCECYKEHLFLLKMKKARIPKEYHNYKKINETGLKSIKKPYNKPFEDARLVNINEDIKKLYSNFNRTIDEGWNFILEGPTGTGKTTFAAIIGRMALHFKYSVLFLELEELRRLWTGETLPPDLAEAKKQIYTVDLLILDDLGKEFNSENSDYMLKNFDSLIRQRTSEKRSTVYTTNLNPDKLSIRYDERIISLLKKQMIHYILHRETDLRNEGDLPDFLL